MLVGVPKEIKPNESRVAITPAGVVSMVKAGHEVIIENNAGMGSGFTNEDFEKAGAKILPTAKDVWTSAEMIMKVKEPLESEYELFQENQILFTYLHLAAEKPLTEALMEKNVVAIAYETVEEADGSLPLLTPMSEVAGRMATQMGSRFLEKPNGGAGVLMGGVPGVRPAEVVVIGGGVVGTNAAKIAHGMGSNVTILDINADRLRYLDDIFHGNINTLMSNPLNIEECAKKADLLIGGVLIPGAKAPKLVSKETVSEMKEGSVIVDVAIDQGGSIETIDRVTTHANPTYVVDGVVHYSVANMPGAVPRTSTIALTNVTMPYAVAIATKGWRKAIQEDKRLEPGVNVVNGKLVYKPVAEGLDLPYTPLEEALN
ncbi:alanine dehydrogenase [Proteinivorax hydrogeniformans]|uniref:Alanine dehydrogenase n=1 Tax=Proteinivorax hydrogeniformans TaxID=1826727 RepID=A0AAU8HRR6_9FIRM